MGNSWKNTNVVLFFAFTVLIGGCGAGGGSASGSASTKMLWWQPPTEYTDGSPLDAVSELDSFEIHVNQSGSFFPGDPPDAAVSAVSSGTGEITRSFDLVLLEPFLAKGVLYHISVRAVAKTGLKSDFSPSATFSY